MDGGSPRKLTAGADPAIAPDGSRVAYTALGKGSERRIVVIDVQSGTKTVFRDVPSDNAFGPIWSPNSGQIIFEIFVNNHWRLGLTTASGTDFAFIGESSPTHSDYYSPVFAPDGKSIYCQDLTNIYQLDLTGKLLTQWKISELVPGCDLDSGSRISPAQDGRRILMDASLSEEGEIKSWNGPAPAVFLWDLASGKSKRLTKGLPYGWAPCWINDVEYFFTGSNNTGSYGIYRASLSGGSPKNIIKNASGVTLGGK
jgi:TolB protein